MSAATNADPRQRIVLLAAALTLLVRRPDPVDPATLAKLAAELEEAAGLLYRAAT